jgi:hypothetical protein
MRQHATATLCYAVGKRSSTTSSWLGHYEVGPVASSNRMRRHASACHSYAMLRCEGAQLDNVKLARAL